MHFVFSSQTWTWRYSFDKMLGLDVASRKPHLPMFTLGTNSQGVSWRQIALHMGMEIWLHFHFGFCKPLDLPHQQNRTECASLLNQILNVKYVPLPSVSTTNHYNFSLNTNTEQFTCVLLLSYFDLVVSCCRLLPSSSPQYGISLSICLSLIFYRREWQFRAIVVHISLWIITHQSLSIQH